MSNIVNVMFRYSKFNAAVKYSVANEFWGHAQIVTQSNPTLVTFVLSLEIVNILTN
jgi:hypothetical protein